MTLLEYFVAAYRAMGADFSENTRRTFVGGRALNSPFNAIDD